MYACVHVRKEVCGPVVVEEELPPEQQKRRKVQQPAEQWPRELVLCTACMHAY